MASKGVLPHFQFPKHHCIYISFLYIKSMYIHSAIFLSRQITYSEEVAQADHTHTRPGGAIRAFVAIFEVWFPFCTIFSVKILILSQNFWQEAFCLLIETSTGSIRPSVCPSELWLPVMVADAGHNTRSKMIINGRQKWNCGFVNGRACGIKFEQWLSSAWCKIYLVCDSLLQSSHSVADIVNEPLFRLYVCILKCILFHNPFSIYNKNE